MAEHHIERVPSMDYTYTIWLALVVVNLLFLGERYRLGKSLVAFDRSAVEVAALVALVLVSAHAHQDGREFVDDVLHLNPNSQYTRIGIS
jgi:hypothetical protein